jgi:hypothetical protein
MELNFMVIPTSEVPSIQARRIKIKFKKDSEALI